MNEKAKDLGDKMKRIDKREVDRRNAVLTWIQRGFIVLILAITVYLSILDGLGVQKTLVMLLLISLVIGAVIAEGRKGVMMKTH